MLTFTFLHDERPFTFGGTIGSPKVFLHNFGLLREIVRFSSICNNALRALLSRYHWHPEAKSVIRDGDSRAQRCDGDEEAPEIRFEETLRAPRGDTRETYRDHLLGFSFDEG